MKKYISFGIVTLTFGLMSFVYVSKAYVAITDNTSSEEAIPNRRNHVDKDVVINRVSRPGSTYHLFVFQNQHGHFSMYRYNRQNNKAFTEAAVIWDNDSIVQVHLQNAANEQDIFMLQISGTTIAPYVPVK